MARFGVLKKVLITRDSQRNFFKQLYININKTGKGLTEDNVDSVV